MDRETFAAAPPDQVLTTRVGRDLALLDLRSAAYFTLDEIGALIWEHMSEPRSLHELVEIVARHYEVEPQVCATDLAALLGELAEAGLLRPATPTPRG